jgi:hypothetical protein
VYDDLSFLLLGASWLRLGAIERAELEMRQISVCSVLCRLSLLDILLV